MTPSSDAAFAQAAGRLRVEVLRCRFFERVVETIEDPDLSRNYSANQLAVVVDCGLQRLLGLGEQARGLLVEIGASANECCEIAKDIAVEAADQSTIVRGVGGSVERLREVVAQIDCSVRSQHAFSSGIHSSITTMRDLGCSVRESTLHQQVESELISSAAETVAERLHRILEAMHHQGEEHERIALALEVFRETAEGNTERASEVQRTVEALERQHGILDDELNRFQL